jgi:hypothetical protein
MKTSYDCLYKCISITLFFILVLGCSASTKPNLPYSGLYPEAFSNLADKNPLLAQELGKIPEIQNGISEKDSIALERICMLYNQNQKDFDSAFERISVYTLNTDKMACIGW